MDEFIIDLISLCIFFIMSVFVLISLFLIKSTLLGWTYSTNKHGKWYAILM